MFSYKILRPSKNSCTNTEMDLHTVGVCKSRVNINADHTFQTFIY